MLAHNSTNDRLFFGIRRRHLIWVAFFVAIGALSLFVLNVAFAFMSNGWVFTIAFVGLVVLLIARFWPSLEVA